MMELIDRTAIPDWISCRTYFQGMPESRTYISNEKNHVYVQLDGISSDLWKLLYDRADRQTMTRFAKDNAIEEQVDDFILTLAEQELLIVKDATMQLQTECTPVCDDEAKANEENLFLRDMQNWLFKNGFMFSLFFELTYRCNLKCVHCYNPKNINQVEIDFDLCKKAIDDAYELGCFRVTFSGGESTTYSHFLELVKYARSKHISVEIFTNGQVLSSNQSLYDEIKKLYPYRICVSLYSTDEATHDKVTDVPGSFKKTYSLINRMKAENINVQIKNFLLNFNCMDCIKVKEYARQIGATSVADISLIPTIEGNKNTLIFAVSEDDLFSLYINPASPLYIDEDFKPIKTEDIKDSSPCYGGFNGLCISPLAEVVICVSLPYSLGNLHSDSLKSIWRSAVNQDKNSKLYQWQNVTIADCKECYQNDYCAFCHYCPGMGYLENGYLRRSDVQCKQAKAKMRAYNYLCTLRGKSKDRPFHK